MSRALARPAMRMTALLLAALLASVSVAAVSHAHAVGGTEDAAGTQICPACSLVQMPAVGDAGVADAAPCAESAHAALPATAPLADVVEEDDAAPRAPPRIA